VCVNRTDDEGQSRWSFFSSHSLSGYTGVKMDNVQRLTEEECANVSITELGKTEI